MGLPPQVSLPYIGFWQQTLAAHGAVKQRPLRQINELCASSYRALVELRAELRARIAFSTIWPERSS